MSLSNLERCKAWIANKPEIDDIRAKLAVVEEKVFAMSDEHPKYADFNATMEALLAHLKTIDDNAKHLSLPTQLAKPTLSGLASDADPDVNKITDPNQKRSAFDKLKAQLGSGADLVKQQHNVAA